MSAKLPLLRNALAILIAVVLPTALAAQSDASLASMLETLSRNVRASLESLPDFICDEKMSWSLAGAQVDVPRVLESEIKIIRQQTPLGHGFIESRRVFRIDGQPVSPGTKAEGPFRSNGAISSALLVSFVTPNYDYKTSGTDVINGRRTVVLAFETKPNQKKPFVRIDGKAWVDTDALQVLRLEQRAYPPENVAHFTAIEYQKLEVDREQFWMPSTVKQKTIPGTGHNSSGFIDDYLAEYQNCRKSPLPNPDEIIRPIPRPAQER